MKIIHCELLDKPNQRCFRLIVIFPATASFINPNQAQIDNMMIVFGTQQILLPEIPHIQLILVTADGFSKVIYLLRDFIHQC